jgi:DNA-binding CsgD family transcriptional regulator
MQILNDRESMNLTNRERQVIALASHGKTTPEIAQEMGVGPETVKSHVKNARRKIGAATRAHAVAKCLRAGVID